MRAFMSHTGNGPRPGVYSAREAAEDATEELRRVLAETEPESCAPFDLPCSWRPGCDGIEPGYEPAADALAEALAVLTRPGGILDQLTDDAYHAGYRDAATKEDAGSIMKARRRAQAEVWAGEWAGEWAGALGDRA